MNLAFQTNTFPPIPSTPVTPSPPHPPPQPSHYLFQHKAFMCLFTFLACGLHVSSRCGVSSSRDSGTVSLFSLHICSSTHHAPASGSSPADRRHTAAEAALPNLAPTAPLLAVLCSTVAQSQQCSLCFQVICLCGLLSACIMHCIIILPC